MISRLTKWQPQIKPKAIYYDKTRTSLKVTVGDYVMLKLNNGYKPADKLNRRFSIQRDGPFQVVEEVSKNAYRLDLPEGMRIHSVINAA